eukprot:1425335-Amphidinium_carterae.1
MQEPYSNVLVVTHGLAMRMLLMRMFNWSPSTFEAVFNAGNCEIWALRKNLSIPGDLPYDFDTEVGAFPNSSRSVKVIYKDGRSRKLMLEDYLKLEPPRTTQQAAALQMLIEQHGLDPDEIEDVDFFAEDRFGKYQALKSEH